MIRRLTMPARKTDVVRWAGAGHTDGLDAWLETDSRPAGGADAARVGERADWSAPSRSVALAYDTADQHSPVGGSPSAVRAVVQEGSRRLMFEAHDYEILLRVAANRQTKAYDLAGQELYEGLPLPGARVKLDVGSPDAATSTDAAGGFRLPPLIHGSYALRIAVAGAVLTTPPIALG